MSGPVGPSSPLPPPSPARTDWSTVVQQIKDGQSPPPPPEIIQLYAPALLLLLINNLISFSFSHATTGALVGGTLGALVAYRHAKKAKLGYQIAMGGQRPHHRNCALNNITLFPAIGHSLFLTGSRFAALVTTFSATKIACEALGNMDASLNICMRMHSQHDPRSSSRKSSSRRRCSHWRIVWSAARGFEGIRWRHSDWFCSQLRCGGCIQRGSICFSRSYQC
jgi:hypothetical protein